MPESRDNKQIVTRNRKARYSYEIVSTLEAGIELRGTEVKSIREGKVNLADSYALVQDGQVYLKNLHITPYSMASGTEDDPTRPRRLLLHKREITKLTIKTQQRGLSLIPLAVYFRGKHVKIELALAVGRRKFDKRQAIAKEEADRRIKQAVRKETGK
ncbi:MAG: SsrA-binding protein SmpB [bacterium]|nr:SsrA-binding protein SmpB [bacterium]